MANQKRLRVESTEEMTERQKSEWLRQCFSTVETTLATVDQETAAAEGAAIEGQA